MGLFDLFKPAWQSYNLDEAIKAVLAETSQTKLIKIAQEVPSDMVRYVAIKKLPNSKERSEAFDKLTDQSVLSFIALKDDSILAYSVIEKITDQSILKEIALNAQYVGACTEAIRKLTDKFALADVAKNARYTDNCSHAVSKIIDQSLLAEIASKPGGACSEAAAKLTDQALLSKLALNSEVDGVRIAAVNAEALTDQALLADIAKNARDCAKNSLGCYVCEVRDRAVGKLTEQTFLIDVAKNGKFNLNRKQAADKLTDKATAQKVYADIIENEDDNGTRCHNGSRSGGPIVDVGIFTGIYARCSAMEALTDQDELVKIAKSPSNKFKYIKVLYSGAGVQTSRNDIECDFRLDAVIKLTDLTLLADVAKNAENQDIREAATKKLADIKTDR